jgi:mannose-1-phosphate guanylyltransferase
MKPNEPEPEYGYILPDGEMNPEAPSMVRKVLGFIEKPDPLAAQEMVQKGGLWNTMVMAFSAKTLIELVQRVVPTLHGSFQRILHAIGSPIEKDVVEEIYRKITPMNFSRGFLEALPVRYPLHLGVLPVRGVFWSDWGSEERVLSILQKMNYSSRFRPVSKTPTSLWGERRDSEIVRS